MLTGYVFNVEFESPNVESKLFFTQTIVYAKSLEIAEGYVARIWQDTKKANIVYEGFFFQ